MEFCEVYRLPRREVVMHEDEMDGKPLKNHNCEVLNRVERLEHVTLLNGLLLPGERDGENLTMQQHRLQN